MAEIKSAIELAMERTKNLVMDDEEKRVLAERDLEIRVKAIVRRFMEGTLAAGHAWRELEALKGDPRSKKALVVKVMLDEINIGGDNSGLFELLGLAGNSPNQSSVEELENLRKAFLKQMDQAGISVKERVIDRLQMLGIGGDAVEPNIEAWPEWQEGIKETALAFEERLSLWKESVTGASSSTRNP
jgi:hypothetical protein